MEEKKQEKKEKEKRRRNVWMEKNKIKYSKSNLRNATTIFS